MKHQSMSAARAAIRRNEAQATASRKANTNTSTQSASRNPSSVVSRNGAAAFQQNQLQTYNGGRQQQQQYQQYQSHQQQPQQSKKPLTIEQAITLITLRLGRLEMWMQETEQRDGNPMTTAMNDDLAQNILDRLNALEDAQQTQQQQIINTPSPTSSAETTVLKQTVEALKTQVAKNIKVLQNTTKALRDDLTNIETLLTTVQTQTASNTAQLEVMNMLENNDAEEEENDEVFDQLEEVEEVEEDNREENKDAIPQTVTIEDEPEETSDLD